MVKSFTVVRKDTNRRIGRVQVNGETRSALSKLASTLQGEGNKALKQASIFFGAAGLIQSAVDGKVDQRVAIPIVGRGKGRDTVDRAFYKGNGDAELSPDEFVEHDGVYFVSDAMHKASVKVVENAISNMGIPMTSDSDDSLDSSRVAKKPKLGVNTVVRNGPTAAASKKVGLVINTASAVEPSISSETDSKMPASPFVGGLSDDVKARMFDAFMSQAEGAPKVDDITKAKMYDLYVGGVVNKDDEGKD